MISSSPDAPWPPQPWSSFQVRPATLAQLPQVAEVMSQVFNPPAGIQGVFFPLYRLTVSADLHKRMRADPDHYGCLAAWWGDLMVGALELSLRKLGSPVHQPQPYISNLAVLPQWRRRGVAQRLLIEAETMACSWGYRSVHLHVLESNPVARRLYEKRDYCVLHTSDDLWQWLGACRQLLLYRHLPPVDPAASPPSRR